MDWKGILLVVGIGLVGYLLGNLLPFVNRTNNEIRYFPYIVTQKEFRYHDSIVVHNNNKLIYEKDFSTDTIRINNLPDSLLIPDMDEKSRQLLGY